MSFPDGTTDAQIIDYVTAQYGPKPPAPPPEEPVGALESGFYGSLGSLEAAGGKAAQAVGLEGLSNYLFEQSRASQEYAAKYQPEVADISQIEGVGDVASFAGSTIAQSLPETAVGVGGAYAGAVAGGSIGAAVGAPFFGIGAVPAAAAGATIGGIIGGAMASLPFFVGSNLQRQAEEQNIPLEETSGYNATVGAIAQSPLDAAFETLVARKLPGAGAALDVVKQGFLKEVARTAGQGAVTEALTEPAQQAIEIAQANPEKLLEFGPEVQQELLNAAAAGALAGGVIGGGAGAIGSITGPTAPDPNVEARRELGVDLQAARQRGDEIKKFGEINLGVQKLVAQPSVGRLKLDKIRIEPTPENKLKTPLERFRLTDFKGAPIAEFTDPVRAVSAVEQYQKITGKKVNLQNLVTGSEIPTPQISVPSVKDGVPAPQAPTQPKISEAIPASPLPLLEAPKPRPTTGEGQRPAKLFKTALGSQYTLFPDGGTARFKTPHPGHDPKDVGQKPKSEKTYFIRPEDQKNLDIMTAQGLPGTPVIAEYKPGVIGVKYTSGPDAGKFVKGTVTKSFDAPEIGLRPVEVWNGGRGFHFGNNITEVTDPPVITPEAIPPAAPAPDIAIGSMREAIALGPSDIEAVSSEEQVAARAKIDAKVEKVAEGVRAALSRYGLKDVQTKFVPAFSDGLKVSATQGTETVIGGKSIINLATGIYDPDIPVEELVNRVVGTLNHESIHSLVSLGLLRENEMQMLFDAAETTKVPGKKYTYLDYAKSVYGPMAATNPAYRNPESLREEAVAEMFRDWRGKKLGPPPEVRGLINRIIESIRSMFNSMRRENYGTIFKEIEEGRVGERPRGTGAQRKGVKKAEEPEARISAEPELPTLAHSPNYPYEQRVPEINAAQINGVIENLEYGAAITLMERVTNSKTFKAIVPERFRPSRERYVSLVQNFADKMLPVGLMVDYIKKNGGTVPDALDAFMQEDLMRSKVGNMLDEREQGLYGDLIRYLRDNNVSMAEFEDYLYARHAEERNERIREINPGADEALGSGMDDEEAKAILAALESNPQKAEILEAERLFRAIIADTNSLRVEAGLTPDFDGMVIEDEAGNQVRIKQYEFYAPLRGFADESSTEGEVTEEIRARIGQGFKIRGREDMRALGRKSKASDIIAHAILQNSEAVIRAEKNKVGLSFLGLIEANPQLAADFGVEVMTKGKKPLKKYISSKGVVKTMVDPMYKNSDDVMVVKREGEEIPIRIDNRFLQKALLSKKSASPDLAEKALSFMQMGNRFLASVNTAWNPEFMLINFPRDLQTALINISQYEIDGIKSKVMKDSFKAIRGVHQVLRDPKAENDWSDWYKMFREDGGNTNGFFGAFTLEDRISRMTDLVNEKDGSAANKAKKAVFFVRDMLENANGAFENAIRLSVYKNVIEAGVPRQRAAQIAKNLTVNFDKRGEYGPVLNSLYLFYNASVQGTLAMAMAAGRSKKVRRAFAGLIVMGMMQDVINSLISGEDEDGTKIYDKIPDYKLEANLILMDPYGITENGYFAIPLPYGFNAFFNMGRAISRNVRGEYKTSEAVTSIGATFLDAFNPVGGTESFLNFIAPTALDPIVALSINQDFTGRRIYPEPFPGSVPKADSQQYWSTTSPIFRNITDFMNTVTGGTEYVPGAVDWNPAVMEYIYDYALGGLGGFMRRTYDTATQTIPAALTGDLENLEVNNVPVFRKLYGNVSERVTFEDYFNKVNHVLARGEELKSAVREGDTERIRTVRARFANELKIYQAVRALANKRNQLASELRKVRENEKMPPEAKRRRQDALQKQIEQITDRVTKLYEDNIDTGYPSLFS